MGTAKSTIDSLQHIIVDYAKPDVFMADGGSHFNNGDVKLFCDTNNVKHVTTAAYAPWCNGLIEGTNKLLLGRLRRLCALNMDECVDDGTEIKPESIPHSWPIHLEEAIRQLNDHIRPNTLRSPWENLFGLAITPEHQAPTDIPEPTAESVSENLALADMLCMNAHLLQLEDVERQKSTWDNRTPAVNFKIDNIVQFYDTKLDGTYKSVNKLMPKWSKLYIISGKSLNSYSLSTLSGTAIPGLFHSCRLRSYIPLRGSNLDIILDSRTKLHDAHIHNHNAEEAEEHMADGMDSLLSPCN